MANITITEAANAIPTIVAAQALGYLKANTVMAQLVTRDWDNDVAQYGNVVKIPVRGALTANNKAANTAVTLQTPSDTVVTVTLNKQKEVSFLIEDPVRAFSRPDYLQGYVSDGMAVIAEALDADLTALYSSFTGGTIDKSGALGPLDAGAFRESQRLLNAAKAPGSDRFMVLDEDGYADASNIQQLINRDYQGDAAATALQTGYLGALNGFRIFMDQKITLATQRQEMAFHRNAAVLVTRPLPMAPAGSGVIQKVMDEDGIGLRVTLSYSPNYLGMQCTIDTLYGVSALRPTFGVVVKVTDR